MGEKGGDMVLHLHLLWEVTFFYLHLGEVLHQTMQSMFCIQFGDVLHSIGRRVGVSLHSIEGMVYVSVGEELVHPPKSRLPFQEMFMPYLNHSGNLKFGPSHNPLPHLCYPVHMIK